MSCAGPTASRSAAIESRNTSETLALHGRFTASCSDSRNDMALRELALFAGSGGGILAGKLLGWRTVCAVERDAYCRRVLFARQRDGLLPAFPVWDDVRTFDGRAWQGEVDVISGGFPCQDISAAGHGIGIQGSRSGLWGEFARIIREVRPPFAFVENSPRLRGKGLWRVLGDLAEMGFDAQWGVLGADDAGAPHVRKRIWIVAAHPERIKLRQQPGRGGGADGAGTAFVAIDGGQGFVADAHGDPRHERRPNHAAQGPGWRDVDRGGPYLADSNGQRELQPRGREPEIGRRVGNGGESVANADGAGLEGWQRSAAARASFGGAARDGGWWAAEPDVGRVAHGVASRVDRLRAIGNGQVPAVAALAWREMIRRWVSHPMGIDIEPNACDGAAAMPISGRRTT